MKRPQTTDLARAIRSFFVEHLPLTRGVSPETNRSYRQAFVLLLRFLAERHSCDVVDLDMGHIMPDDLLAFLNHLEEGRGNCSASRNARLAAVHSFARFCATNYPEHIETCQRLRAIPIKRSGMKAVEYLEAEEIDAMLSSIDHQKAQNTRDRALILTLFNTGARVRELLGICSIDLDLEGPYRVKLHGKGRKERICPLWACTAEALKDLLSSMPRQLDAEEPVFRNRRDEPLTRFGVRHILKQCAERAKLRNPQLKNRRVHPHSFRHSTAIYLLRSGVDLVTISHWLGHESVETTNRYAAIDLEAKRKILEKAGPVCEAADRDMTD